MFVFDQSLTVAGEVVRFNFREIISPETEKFFISVQNGNGPRTSFEMKRVYDGWVLVPPYPEWVKPLERDLEKVIREKTAQP